MREGGRNLTAAAGTALSVTASPCQLSQGGEPRELRSVLAPRIYEGGGPRSGRGSSPAAAGKASSVTAAPCQLPQRGSRGCFAPFLPPAFMRGEGHEVAGGVPRRRSGNPLRHGCAVPALPKGETRGRAPITGHSEPVTDVTGVRIPRMNGAAERQGAAALPLYDLTGSLPGIRLRRTQFFCPGFLSIFVVKFHKNPQQNAESSSCAYAIYAENVHFYTKKLTKLQCNST